MRWVDRALAANIIVFVILMICIGIFVATMKTPTITRASALTPAGGYPLTH